MRSTLRFFAFVVATAGIAAPVAPPAEFPAPAAVRLGGVLGGALEANRRGRLSHFIQDESSPALALFSPQGVAANTAGVYWGEHAGKWLVASARAANRTGDPVLAAQVRRAADYLVRVQEPDGYLGTYPPSLRFMLPQHNLKKEWDVWTLSCVMLGLLETNKYFPNPAYLNAARKIADLCWQTFAAGPIKVTDCGNHHGLSGTVLLDPAVELYRATGEPKYLALARLILREADEPAELKLSSVSLAGGNLQKIGDGKIYQLCWNLVGIAKLYGATGDPADLKIVRQDWEAIRHSHLTLEGGPWGGVGVPREEFDPADFFSPCGYVETCSIMSWIQLNRELLRLTGEARYAEEIERSAYNALLGAQDPNGEDWCYYTFPNGKRTNTGYWSCCKSSGALALEELPPLAYDLRRGRRDIAVDLYGPGEAALRTATGEVTLRQVTDYPFDGAIHLFLTPEPSAEFALLLRIPAWAEGTTIAVNGSVVRDPVTPGSYATLRRVWHAHDEISLAFPMPPVWHTASSQSLHGVFGQDGKTVTRLEVSRYDYGAITRGPLVYATGLLDGFKREETLLAPDRENAPRLELAPSPPGCDGPAIRLRATGRQPILFVPYYEAGGRTDGAWRLTWMQTVAD